MLNQKIEAEAKTALVSNLLVFARRLGGVETIDGEEYIKEMRIHNGNADLRNLCRSLGIEDSGYSDLIDIENQSGVDKAYINFTNKVLKTEQVKGVIDHLRQYFNLKTIEVSANEDEFGNYDFLHGSFSNIYPEIPNSVAQMFYAMRVKWNFGTVYDSENNGGTKVRRFHILIPELTLQEIEDLKGIEDGMLNSEIAVDAGGEPYNIEEYEVIKREFKEFYENNVIHSSISSVVTSNGLRISSLRKVNLKSTLTIISYSLKIRIKKDSVIRWKKIVGQVFALFNTIALWLVRLVNKIPILRSIAKHDRELVGGIFGMSAEEWEEVEAKIVVVIVLSYITGGWASEVAVGEATASTVVLAAVETGTVVYMSSKTVSAARTERMLMSQKEKEAMEKEEESRNQSEFMGAIGLIGRGLSSHRNVRKIKAVKGRGRDRHFK